MAVVVATAVAGWRLGWGSKTVCLDNLVLLYLVSHFYLFSVISPYLTSYLFFYGYLKFHSYPLVLCTHGH